MFRRSFLLGLLLSSFLFARGQFKAGVTTRVFHTAVERNWRGSSRHEFHCTVWYPAVETAIEIPQTIGPPDAPLFDLGLEAQDAEPAPALKPLPLILLSHGSGSASTQMSWLGAALARAGFLAVVVDHPGNNSNEPYTAEGFSLWWERATDISEVLDGMLADPSFGPRIDRNRIGAAGFSIGGYTVLALAGARTNMHVIFDACAQNSPIAVCHVPEMRELGTFDQIESQLRRTSSDSLSHSTDSFRDPRIRSVFAVAPALGQVFTADSLRGIHIPVAIVVGAADPLAVPSDSADYIHANVKGSSERTMPGVAHYTFLATCLPAGKQQIPQYCVDASVPDRNVIHAAVNADAITFFRRTLKVK